MPGPRHHAVRGSVPKGERGPAPKPEVYEPETVHDPASPRAVIDYGLQRRTALRSLFNGGALTSDFFDADQYLLRAAKNHGEAAGACPACKTEGLMHVTYVYGDELGPYSGRVRTSDELVTMAPKFGRFRVYVVEVCQHCQWNFMIRQFVLGDGQPRRPLPTPRDLLD
jgi:hypothetical protein